MPNETLNPEDISNAIARYEDTLDISVVPCWVQANKATAILAISVKNNSDEELNNINLKFDKLSGYKCTSSTYPIVEGKDNNTLVTNKNLKPKESKVFNIKFISLTDELPGKLIDGLPATTPKVVYLRNSTTDQDETNEIEGASASQPLAVSTPTDFTTQTLDAIDTSSDEEVQATGSSVPSLSITYI